MKNTYLVCSFIDSFVYNTISALPDLLKELKSQIAFLLSNIFSPDWVRIQISALFDVQH